MAPTNVSVNHDRGERLEPYHVAGVRRVQEQAVSDVDTHVTELVEEQQIADLQLGLIEHRPLLDDRAEAVLRGGKMRERKTVLGPQPHHQSRAVEPGG